MVVPHCTRSNPRRTTSAPTVESSTRGFGEVMRGAAAAGLAMCLLVVAMTFAGGSLLIPEVALLPLGVAIFPVWASVLPWIVARRDEAGGLWGAWAPVRSRTSPPPARLLLVCLTLFAAAWLTSIPAGLRGNPLEQGGHYYLDDHGSLVTVDAAVYRAAVRGEERFAASVLGAFYAVGLAASAAKLAVPKTVD